MKKKYNNGFVLTGSRLLLNIKAGRPAAQTAGRYRAFSENLLYAIDTDFRQLLQSLSV